MKKNQKRNKKYNPNNRHLNPNSAFDAIRHSLPLPTSAKGKLFLHVRLAIEAFSKGVADTYNFDVMASTIDLCEIMRVSVFNGAYNDEIHAARLGMLRAKERYENTGSMGLDGQAFNAVKILAQIHEQMLNQVTGHELKQFIEKRKNNIRGGNFFKGTAADLEKMAA